MSELKKTKKVKVKAMAKNVIVPIGEPEVEKDEVPVVDIVLKDEVKEKPKRKVYIYPKEYVKEQNKRYYEKYRTKILSKHKTDRIKMNELLGIKTQKSTPKKERVVPEIKKKVFKYLEIKTV